MKIKRLILTSFGKFKDRTIEVNDGFNLIYGENEAGKSTVQHFIEGMIFGFYKPYRKKRTYSENFERFKPWNSDAYCGAMILEENSGKVIRIERDFLKKQDAVKIFDNVTGENITEEYPYDNVTRQHLPLRNSKMNSVIYNNTVNIKQMSSESDADLAKEVNDRLLELGSAQNEEISLNRVMNYLSQKKKNIGAYGHSKSTLGVAMREMEKLEDMLDESERAYKVIRENQGNIQKYKKKIEAAQSKYHHITEKSKAKTRAGLENMQEKVHAIGLEGEALQEKLKALEKYQGFDTDTYGRLKILQNNLEGVKKRNQTLSEEVEVLKHKCQDIGNRCSRIKQSLKGLSRNEIQMDYQKYQFALKNPEEIENQEYDDEVLEEKVITTTFNRVPNGVLILSMILGALFVFAGAIELGGFLTGVLQIFVCFIGFFLLLGGGLLMLVKRKLSGDSYSKSDLKEESVKTSNLREEDPLTTVEVILQKYNKKTQAEYRAFVKKAEDVFNRLDKLTMDENIFVNQLQSKQKELEKAKSDEATFKGELEEALENADVKSIDAYNEGCQYRNDLEKVKSDIAANKRLYDELSGGNIIKVDLDAEEQENPVVMVTPEGEKIRARDALLAFNQEVSRLQGENTMLIGSVPNPVELRERIEALKNQVSEYQEDVEACDLALNIFGKLSKETHYDSAPALNEKIGKVLKQITHKYQEVKIDQVLQVKVVNPENGDLIDIGQLSGGTIDQIYFALRFGIGGLLEVNKTMPFVLDDPFMQYDCSRKTEAMRFLCDLSKGRQVLLFTCSGDEKRILDKDRQGYSGIIL